MHSKTIPLFLIVASFTSTSLGLHHRVIEARQSLEIIFPRQTDSCDTICAPVESTLGSCTSTSCLCTIAIANSLQNCINCFITTDPSVSVVSSAQSLIDTFESLCAPVAGVPSVTIATGASPSTPTGTTSETLPGVSVPPTTPTTATTVVPVTTVSQIVIGPSSTTASTASTASSAGNTGTGLPLVNSASPSKVVLPWTGALLGLAAGTLLAF